MRPPETPPHHLVSVYEAVNADLREVYVGSTTRLMPDVARRFKDGPPGAASHWGPQQRVTIRMVAYSVPLKESWALIEQHAAAAARPGWRVHHERPVP